MSKLVGRGHVARGAALLLLVVAAWLGVPGGVGVATAENVSQASFEFSPSGVPRTTYKRGTIEVHTSTVFENPGMKSLGGFPRRVQLFFDDDFNFSAAGVPSCTTSFGGSTTLAQAMSACGNARVGSGEASTAPSSNFPGCVLLFNGAQQAGRPTLVLFTRVTLTPNATANCANPATNNSGTTSVTLTGFLRRNPAGMPADYAGGSTLDVPNLDLAPLPLDDFTATVRRGRYVSARCHDADREWNTRTTFTYSGSSEPPDTINASQACEVRGGGNGGNGGGNGGNGGGNGGNGGGNGGNGGGNGGNGGGNGGNGGGDGGNGGGDGGTGGGNGGNGGGDGGNGGGDGGTGGAGGGGAPGGGPVSSGTASATGASGGFGGGSLPFTGLAVGTLALVAMGLLGAGFGLRRRVSR
jgi:hypothetical protein